FGSRRAARLSASPTGKSGTAAGDSRLAGRSNDSSRPLRVPRPLAAIELRRRGAVLPYSIPSSRANGPSTEFAARLSIRPQERDTLMNEISGQFVGEGRSFALVVSRFNALVSERLLEGAVDALRRHGVSEDDLTVVRTPGAFEIPPVAR